VQELRLLLARRDQHNQRLYGEVASLTRRLGQTQAALLAGWPGKLRYVARRLLGAIRRQRLH